jgi:hypothetical protein
MESAEISIPPKVEYPEYESAASAGQRTDAYVLTNDKRLIDPSRGSPIKERIQTSRLER